MSGLPLRASRLLFTWQLLWLLVQAAPAQPGAPDPVLLNSVAPGHTEPWPLDQQTPPMNSFMAEDFESLLLHPESSALPAEVPEETEAFPTPQESPAHRPEDTEAGEHTSTQKDMSAQSALSPDLDQSLQVADGLLDQRPTSSGNAGFSVQEESSALPHLPVSGAESPSVLPQGPALETLAQLPSEGEAMQLQQTLAPPQHPEENHLHSAPFRVEQPNYTDITIPPSNLELTITPGPAVEAKKSTDLTHPAAASVHPEVTLPHPEPVEAQQPSLTSVKVPPLDLEVFITPGTSVEAEHHPTLKKTTAPPKRPEVTLPHPEPGQAQQPSLTSVTVPPLDLEVSITPGTSVEAEYHPTLKKTAAPPKRPEVTLPHPEPGQAQQPSLTSVTVPPLDLEVFITPGTSGEAEHHPTLKKTATPPKRPEVTLPHPEPGQAQQPSLTSVTVPPLDMEVTITPGTTVEAEHHPTLKKTSAPPKRSEVTLPHPEPGQAQQPSLTSVTVPPLDLEVSITPGTSGEAENHPTLKKTRAPPKRSKVTLPNPEPGQAQQPSLTSVTVPPLDLGVPITPGTTLEAEHHPTMKKTRAPPKRSKMTLPQPEPVQAQQPSLTSVTVPPLDLGVTITPGTTVEAEHHPTMKKTRAPPKRSKVTLPNPEPGQAQQPSLTSVTVPPLDLGVPITPGTTLEAEHHPTMKKTRAPPKRSKVTLPHPEPGQAQQPTFSEVTVPPFDLELSINPETTREAKHHPTLKKMTAPPKRPEVTLPHPEPVQAQQPSLTSVTVPPLDTEVTITPGTTVEAEHHPTMKKMTAPPKRPEVTLPHPEPGQAQQPTLSDITVPPSAMELTITPQPTLAAEHPAPRQQTAAPPRHPPVTFPQPQPVQAWPPIFSDVPVPPVVLELTIRGQAVEKAEHHLTSKRNTAPLKQAEVPLPYPEAADTQQTTFSDVRLLPLNLEPTATPEPTVGAGHARALQQTPAPPEHPLGMVLTQDPQPSLPGVTGHSAELDFIRTRQPETSESGPPANERSALVNICGLCSCRNETLSCTGLSLKQRLHRVPVLYPQSHNGSFTVLNFKGNAISYIDRDSWESYHWVQKLILSENDLRELHKDSFEGLLSLQYLDLSSNKIQLIERNTFEYMPFLQQINLHNNLITNVRFGTFQAWHGMQFLHTLILSHNPLTTVEDSYLFKLPALRHLDMGRTQVSLTTVESVLLMALKLRKLILPSHLACCLCQFKSSIQAVSKTVRLHCDSDCPTHTQCDEELHLGSTEGSLMKVLQGREKRRNSPELTIEPERASPGEEKGGGLPAFMNLLTKLLTEQEKVEASKADWGTDHWGHEGTEAQGEEEEQESREFRAQVPGYGYKNKLILAAPVIAVTTIFMVLFCLMAICPRRTAEEGKEGRGFFSMFGHKERSTDHEAQGGLQRRWPLWLWDMYCPLNATHKGDGEQNASEEDELLEKMEKGEASTSTAKAGTSDSGAEETGEESDA